MYPSLLADRGLVHALRAAAARAPVTVAVEAHDVGRYGADVESAVYFCVMEGLQNVLKHATGVGRAVVRLDGSTRGALRFSVRDDGAGAMDLRAGAGIVNMRDRMAAVGGDVEVTSTPGVGTVVRGFVPVGARPASDDARPTKPALAPGIACGDGPSRM